MTTAVLKQALEALEGLFSGKRNDNRAYELSAAIAALRHEISQPDCRGCRWYIPVDGSSCWHPECTNGDKFQALPKVVLYKVTK